MKMMKKRWISLLLILVLVMAAGCGKKNTTKKVKTEDLDEATLQGMAKDITKDMSLKNKIGQLFMVSIYQLDEAESKNQTKITDAMKKTLKKYPAGGIVMFAKNIETREQTKKMIKKFRMLLMYHYLWQWMKSVEQFQELHLIQRLE